MSIWTKATMQGVHLSIRGDIYSEHIEFLQNILLERLRYGFRYIVIEIMGICLCVDQAAAMLEYVRSRFRHEGGELIVQNRSSSFQID